MNYFYICGLTTDSADRDIAVIEGIKIGKQAYIMRTGMVPDDLCAYALAGSQDDSIQIESLTQEQFEFLNREHVGFVAP